jgi:DNA-binding HxlR family transcriptional regulator
MSEDVKEELKKLREEMAGLKDRLKDMAGEGHGRRRGMYIDFGNTQDYLDDVMRGVANGVHGELERSIFIGPGGCRMWKGHRHEGEEEEERRIDFSQAAKAMSALGQEHRLKILDALMTGGRYINELQEELKEITTSTLSSHLDVLEEVGLVVQEKVRGRYLITMPGRTAYQMARKVSRFLEAGGGEE